MAGTLFRDLKRKVLMGTDVTDGVLIRMAEEAINMACHAIAEVHNFDELIVTDTTNAHTAVSTKSYDMVTDWLLTRPKDIISIKLYDAFNSRKLDYIAPQTIDTFMPYPEGLTTTWPQKYTQYGTTVELLPIPNAIYDLHVRYYQWPVVLTTDADTCSYENIDSTIIALSRDIFLSLKNGLMIDYAAKARGYLKISMSDDRSRPDELPIARPFKSRPTYYKGEPWNNPFIKSTGGDRI